MKIDRVNIIGYGNVGKALMQQLSQRVQVINVFSRKFTEGNNVSFVTALKDLSKNVDLNIVCVNDDSIGEVVAQLPKTIPAVHTSGSVDIAVFKDFENFGVLYPLQTFSEERKIEMESIPFFIESNSDNFSKLLEDFCQSNLSKTVHHVTSEQRAKLHLAAVFANNFVTLLAGISEEILADNKMKLEIFQPLLSETINKITALGYEKSQTGPARRGDLETINKHLKMLEKQDYKDIYQLLSNEIMKKFNS